MKIDKNSYVTIDHLIRIDEHETYPANGQPEEISFCLGWGVMPLTLEESMIGMDVNEHKELHLTAEEAYGEVDQDLIMEVPRSDFGPEVELRPGMIFETENEEGQEVYFIVKDVLPNKVVIDFNHPLAGKELEVSFTVRQIREATAEELAQHPGCEWGEGGAHQQY